TSGVFSIYMALKVGDMDGNVVAEGESAFESTLLDDDAACGGLPRSRYNAVVERKPCWKVTFHGLGPSTPNQAVNTLESEGLPGMTTLPYYVTADQSGMLDLRRSGAGGRPEDPLNYNSRSPIRWQIRPPDR